MISERFNKTFVPLEQREKIFKKFHNIGHFSSDELFRQVWTSGKYWPSLRKDAIKYVDRCRICCAYNVTRQGFHAITHTTAKFPMDHIALDLAEVETSISGYKYILVIIDICTKFVVLRALRDKSATTIAQELWKIFALLGVSPEFEQVTTNSDQR